MTIPEKDTIDLTRVLTEHHSEMSSLDEFTTQYGVWDSS